MKFTRSRRALLEQFVEQSVEQFWSKWGKEIRENVSIYYWGFFLSAQQVRALLEQFWSIVEQGAGAQMERLLEQVAERSVEQFWSKWGINI